MTFPPGMLATTSIDEVRTAVAAARADGRRIACVPTMGALHAGHLSLMEHAREVSGFVAVTIFVNPTQFGPQEDLAKYPRPLDADLKACRDAGVDLVFVPDVEAIYPAGFATFVEVDGLSTVLEGAARPGHFRGVTTVVLKLLNIVQPDVAVFGQKDFQQQALIRRMVRDLNVPVEIDVRPTVREADGLALSSRNVYLSPVERKSALSLSESLNRARDCLLQGDTDLHSIREEMLTTLRSRPSVEPDYAVIVDPDTLQMLSHSQPHMAVLVAARVGSTRLIDNLVVELPAAPNNDTGALHTD